MNAATMLAQTSIDMSVPLGEQLFAFSPMIALTATMLAVVGLPVIFGRGTKLVAGTSALGVLVAFVLALRVLGFVAENPVSGLSTDLGGGMFVADNLSLGFQLILYLFLSAVTLLWWMGSAATERDAPEFFILLLGSALGMAMMVSTTNLLMIVIAIEAASLPSYAIVGFNKRSPVAAEASLKYMVFGAVCAAIMLYGASLLYGLVGTLNLADVAAFAYHALLSGEHQVITLAAMLCLLAGVAFKISAVPFHFWCPDAFEGAKVEVTTWLSVVSKAAGLMLLARLVLALCSAAGSQHAMSVLLPVAWGLGIMATLTCTVGNFAAYWQRSVKRLLAYSSIAHAGYMMMAAALFMYPTEGGPVPGVGALIAYVLIYMVMNLGAFGVTALVTWDTGSDFIESFSGLFRRSPGLATSMVVCLVSLVGLPPLAGFWAKWWILYALGSAGGFLPWFLVVVAVVNTLISLYYYMRLVVQMALRDAGDPELKAPVGGVALTGVCAALLLVFFVFGQPLRNATTRFAAHLFRPVPTSPATDSVAMSRIPQDAP